jgi:hypothetical protein
VHGQRLEDVVDDLPLFLDRPLADGLELPEQAADLLVVSTASPAN